MLLDFLRKEHEPLLLSLAKSQMSSSGEVYDVDDVLWALSRESPQLKRYQRDSLNFYAPENIAGRRKRWDCALAPLIGKDEWDPPLSREKPEKGLGDLLPLARRAQAEIRKVCSSLDKPELLRQHDLARELCAAIGQEGEKYRLFRDFLERDLRDWLVSLPVHLAPRDLVNEACGLAEAWAKIVDPETFLGDRALILAKAGRGEEARRQVRENLARFPKDVWVRIKAGEACRALKDLPGAEEHFRRAIELTKYEHDRREAVARLTGLLKETGRAEEAEALKAGQSPQREEELQPVETHVREKLKAGRNAPCPCGSGRKYKKCCGR